MTIGQQAAQWFCVVVLILTTCALAASRASARLDAARVVVVLYPESSNGSPGNALVDQGIRSTFAAGASDRVEIFNEYLDVSRFHDPAHQRLLADNLRRKFAGRKVEVVIAGLSTGLDFALKFRSELFPGAAVVFCAVDEREVEARELPGDVIGVPIRFDLKPTLDLALRLHPNTRRVFVVAGKSRFDAYWEAQAREAFRPYADRCEFVYLSGQPMGSLLKEVARLPERSVIYYVNVFQDGEERVLVPAEVVERLAEVANAPIYGHVDTFVGRGLVGGRVFGFERAGQDAARLSLRLLAGERPEAIGIEEPSENPYQFDWRQLRRWGVREKELPSGSVLRFKQQGFWELYKWPIVGVTSLCVVEALLIAALLVQRANRRQAEQELCDSQGELRVLTGRLLQAQEAERRRIARELHDDLNQNLALLSVELDLLAQRPPPATQLAGRMGELSAQVKQLSSSVHELSHQLHPAKLEQLGLVAGVAGLCKELAQSHDLLIAFTHREVPAAIPAETALCLYRIAQEALRNVIKHSGARQAGVELIGSGPALFLRVADDGGGFDPAVAPDRGGLGLVSMRERLRLVGGEITIGSSPSAGTRIEVRVPLAVTAAPGGGLLEQPLPVGYPSDISASP